MKKRFLWFLGLMIGMSLLVTPGVAQTPAPLFEGFGINVDTPRAMLHVGGRVRIDSAQLYNQLLDYSSREQVPHFLVIDSTHMVQTLPLDSFIKTVGAFVGFSGNEKPEMVVSDNNCPGSYVGNIYYNNSNAPHMVSRMLNNCCFYTPQYGLQTCRIDSIVNSPLNNSPYFSGSCIVNDYVYLCFDAGGNDTALVFRFPIHNFSTQSAERVKVIGKQLGVCCYTTMTACDTTFYFSNQGGSRLIGDTLSVYTLSGNTLVFKEDIALPGITVIIEKFFVKENGEIFLFNQPQSAIFVYDHLGNYLRKIGFQSTYFYNWNNTIYSTGMGVTGGILKKTPIF